MNRIKSFLLDRPGIFLAQRCEDAVVRAGESRPMTICYLFWHFGPSRNGLRDGCEANVPTSFKAETV